MTIDRALNILALITLIEMMFYIGLSVSVPGCVNTAKDWKLVWDAILANYALVPAVTIGLLLLFHATPLVAVGFLVLAVAPAGPYGAPYTAIAKGDVNVAAGLMIVLAALSPVLTPVLLRALAPIVAGSEPIKVDAAKVLLTLLLGQILPLLAGMALNHLRPQLAQRFSGPAGVAAKLLNVAFLLSVLAVQFRMLLEIKWLGFLGMMILLLATIAIGWLAGGRSGRVRRAMAMTTSVRNSGVGMVVATGSFPGTPAVTAAVVYGVVVVLGSLGAAVAWGRISSSEPEASSGATP